jgi:hypothetical protein
MYNHGTEAYLRNEGKADAYLEVKYKLQAVMEGHDTL